VRVDAVGSVIGRYAGAQPDAPTVMLGSHFDSVRNGGKYDGILGILVPIACVAEMHRKGERSAAAIEVIAFSDEEGARFSTSFLASRALIGKFDAAVLERRDAEGVTLAEAMRSAGLDPARIESAKVDPASLAAYVEIHIEQGPVLLKAGLPLGVVTSIASGARYGLRVSGEVGHAGTVPMGQRHDALAAAAEVVLAAEALARSKRGGVATVGVLKVHDGSSNVIPGDVELTVDVRAPDDELRHELEWAVLADIEAIAFRRGVKIAKTKTHEVRAAPCAPWLQERLAASLSKGGIEVKRLPSGAGHDAMILAEVTDVAMLFVRCGAGGVSHNPAETITAADAGLAVATVLDFLRRFEPDARPGR
jgi:hydantoinase/carbamoylase family amidase